MLAGSERLWRFPANHPVGIYFLIRKVRATSRFSLFFRVLASSFQLLALVCGRDGHLFCVCDQPVWQPVVLWWLRRHPQPWHKQQTATSGPSSWVCSSACSFSFELWFCLLTPKAHTHRHKHTQTQTHTDIHTQADTFTHPEHTPHMLLTVWCFSVCVTLLGFNHVAVARVRLTTFAQNLSPVDDRTGIEEIEGDGFRLERYQPLTGLSSCSIL